MKLINPCSASRRLFIVFLIFGCIPGSKAQLTFPGKGRAVIYFTSPTPVTVRLDTALLKITKEPIWLPEGRYVVRAWAPTKKLFIDTIIVKEGRTALSSKSLEDSEEYLTYKKQLTDYKFKRTCFTVVPPVVTLLYTGACLARYSSNKKNMKKHLENAREAEANYLDAVSSEHIQRYKDEYSEEKSAYENASKKNRVLLQTSAVVIPVCLAATVVLDLLSKRILRPVYNEKPLLTLNSLGVTRDGNIHSLYLSFNLN